MRRTSAAAILIILAASATCAPVDSTSYQLPAPGPRCSEANDTVTCAHVAITLHGRRMYLMLPDGTAPPSGWPVAILFQGSFHPAEQFWRGHVGDEYGGYHQARVVRALLENGFAVITPDAPFGGSAYWETNVIGYASAWESSDDHAVMLALLAALDAHSLGPLDAARLFASGISSGGYMTSRMAISYRGRFRALAIQSASYATCSGSICSIPALPSDHPPTLFLHGEQDAIVPISTMRSYDDALRTQGTAERVVVSATAGHEWLPVAPDEVVAWFRANL